MTSVEGVVLCMHKVDSETELVFYLTEPHEGIGSDKKRRKQACWAAAQLLSPAYTDKTGLGSALYEWLVTGSDLHYNLHGALYGAHV